MSTDPREFEHPIDGTGGTVMPEAIEAAARALCGTPFPDTWEKLGTDIQALYRHEAEDALTAALPFIAAQAKAEALREAADDFPAELPEFAYMRDDGLIDYTTVDDWLIVRAERVLCSKHCPTCGIDLQYPTALHLLDCPKLDVTP